MAFFSTVGLDEGNNIPENNRPLVETMAQNRTPLTLSVEERHTNIWLRGPGQVVGSCEGQRIKKGAKSDRSSN